MKPVSITFTRTVASSPTHEPAYEFNAEDLDALIGSDLHNLAICLRSLVSECEARARALQASAKSTDNGNDRWVDVDYMAERLGKTPRAVKELIRRCKLPGVFKDLKEWKMRLDDFNTAKENLEKPTPSVSRRPRHSTNQIEPEIRRKEKTA